MMIPGTEGGHTPFFSPDGEWIGFFTDDALKKVPVSGGAAMTLAPAQALNLGASWGRDGTIVYVPEAGADAVLMRISQAGGEPEQLTRIGVLEQPQGPQFLADGETVLYSRTSTEYGGLLTIPAKSGEVVAHEAPEGSFSYLPTGHLLHWSAGTIAATPFDIEAGKVQGDGGIVLQSIATSNAGTPIAVPYLAVSESGTLAYVSGLRQDGAIVSLVQRDGRSTPLWTGRVHAPRVSPDGNRIAYNLEDLWIYDLGRATQTHLTVGGTFGNPAWRPDGRAIAFRRAGAVYEIPADGSVEAHLLVERDFEVESWSTDGRHLALTEANSSTGLNIWILAIGGEATPFLVTPASENAAVFSPNGRFIAYLSNESGQDEIYVRPFPQAEGKWKVSANGGTAPVWARDGTELFYRAGENVMAARVRTGADFDFDRPVLVASGNYMVDGSGHPLYDVMPDGSFVLVERNPEAALTEIHVVLNWFEELNRLVPTE